MANSATARPDLPPERLALVQQVLADSGQRTEQALRNYLQDLEDAPPRLLEAMSYSLFAGGKRLRPALVFAAGRMFGAAEEALMPAAAAMECVHTFSLIHDDLPAMDDDDLRRGKPANHKVFGEAIAILAGDALLALAFEIVTRAGAESEGDVQDNIARKSAFRQGSSAMVRELAIATGAGGMIGGQVADMLGEQHEPTEADVRYIHERKTAALIAASCRLGAIAAGAGDADIAALGHYGYHLGLAFQLADDALDATATAEQLGKRTGKDTRAGKQTMVRLAGVEATMQAASREVEQALASLEPYGPLAESLRAVAEFVIRRRS